MIPVVVVEETTTYDKFGAVPRLFNTIGSSLISVSAYTYIYYFIDSYLSIPIFLLLCYPSTRSSFFFNRLLVLIDRFICCVEHEIRQYLVPNEKTKAEFLFLKKRESPSVCQYMYMYIYEIQSKRSSLVSNFTKIILCVGVALSYLLFY